MPGLLASPVPAVESRRLEQRLRAAFCPRGSSLGRSTKAVGRTWGDLSSGPRPPPPLRGHL